MRGVRGGENRSDTGRLIENESRDLKTPTMQMILPFIPVLCSSPDFRKQLGYGKEARQFPI